MSSPVRSVAASRNCTKMNHNNFSMVCYRLLTEIYSLDNAHVPQTIMFYFRESINECMPLCLQSYMIITRAELECAENSLSSTAWNPRFVQQNS